jgi:hypothetical protein
VPAGATLVGTFCTDRLRSGAARDNTFRSLSGALEMSSWATAYRGPHHLNKGFAVNQTGCPRLMETAPVRCILRSWFAEPSRSGTAGSRPKSPPRPGPAQLTTGRGKPCCFGRAPDQANGIETPFSLIRRSGTKRMSRTSNTKRYYEIARDCLRSAQHADNPATRDKLLDQAQVWMDAAMRETFIATIGVGDPHEPSQPDLRNEARAVRSGWRRTMSR